MGGPPALTLGRRVKTSHRSSDVKRTFMKILMNEPPGYIKGGEIFD
jgi:hypothetical protein